MKAHQQLLTQQGGDSLESRQLRKMSALLKPRHRAMGGTGCLSDLLLRKAQLKPALAQMRRDRADLSESANALAFGNRLPVCLTTISAFLHCNANRPTTGMPICILHTLATYH